MNIKNIKLNDYERELLDKAVKKSNQNFKFIINFFKKKKEN